ncbi:MAG: hypothetical protein QM692_15780, partial [Thermomicrobiales bacterium]
MTALLGGALAAPLLGRENADEEEKEKETVREAMPGRLLHQHEGRIYSAGQQSNGLCGSGGAICRSTGCAGTCPNCACSASDPCPTGQCCRGDGTCGACLAFVSSSGQNG